MSHLRLHPYGIGDYVSVSASNRSSGGTGWIKSVASDGRAIVEYVVPKKLSKDVAPSRIALKTLDNIGRSQSQDGVMMPSLLSPSYGAARSYRNSITAPVDDSNRPQKPRHNGKLLTDDLLRMDVENVYDYLDKNKHNKGWLRVAESSCNRLEDLPKQLSTPEKDKAMALRRYIKGVNLHAPTDALAKAWNITDRHIRRLDGKGVNQHRKKRSDFGTNILNNPKKQQQCLNTYQVFKKSQRRQSNRIAVATRKTSILIKIRKFRE